MASSQMEYILQNMQKELEAQVEKVTKCRNEKGLLKSYKDCIKPNVSTFVYAMVAQIARNGCDRDRLRV